MKTDRLLEFNRLLACAVERKMPLPEALSWIAKAVRKPRLKSAVEDVRSGVLQGESLDQAMGRRPDVFDETYRAAVAAGLASGNLAKVLRSLIVWQETMNDIRRAMMPVLGYGAAILIIICVILQILRIPGAEFALMYQELGIPLPIPTHLVLGFLWHSTFVTAGLLSIPALAFLGWRICMLGVITGRMVYWIPVFGDILKISCLARFFSLSGALIEAGRAVDEAIELAARAEKNAYFRKVAGAIAAELREGKPFSNSAAHSGFFPKSAVWMIRAGETRGQLSEYLSAAALSLKKELDGMVAPLPNTVTAALCVMVGGGVGFVVISLYLPLIDMMRFLG